MYGNYLAHYGVPGMQWGKRKAYRARGRQLRTQRKEMVNKFQSMRKSNKQEYRSNIKGGMSKKAARKMRRTNKRSIRAKEYKALQRKDNQMLKEGYAPRGKKTTVKWTRTEAKRIAQLTSKKGKNLSQAKRRAAGEQAVRSILATSLAMPLTQLGTHAALGAGAAYMARQATKPTILSSTGKVIARMPMSSVTAASVRLGG